MRITIGECEQRIERILKFTRAEAVDEALNIQNQGQYNLPSALSKIMRLIEATYRRDHAKSRHDVKAE